MNYRVQKLDEARNLLDPENPNAYEDLKAELLGRDPLAMLAHVGLEKAKNMRLLGFENTYPGIKTLNDKVFRGDHAMTDEYAERVQKMLKDEMGDEIIPVNLFVKGGFLLVPDESDAERDALLNRFEENAARILREFLIEKHTETGEDHYLDYLALYRQTGMRFTYGSAKWPEGELTMKGAAETLALTTGMLKYGVSRADRRPPNENETEDERRTGVEDRREQPKVVEMTKEEYVHNLKLGLRASWERAYEIYNQALKERNTEKLKAFCVQPRDMNSAFILLRSEAFSALRKGEFAHESLSAFTDPEKKALNAYRKAVNSMDVITPNNRDSEEAYFKSIEETLRVINSEDLEKMRDLARVSHKDPVLHKQEGVINNIDDHCIVTRARLAEVFGDTMRIEGHQLTSIDIIGFGYINHISLAKLVPQVLAEADPDKVVELLSCPLHEANLALDEMRHALKNATNGDGLVDGEGGDEMIVLRWGSNEWTLTIVPNAGAFRVASFTIDSAISPAERMTALAEMMEAGDRYHAAIKDPKNLSVQNPVNTGFVHED